MLTIKHFPVQIPTGFKPSDIDGDGTDIGGTGQPCPCQSAVDGFKPRWGGGFRAERLMDGKVVFHRALDIMSAEGALVVAPVAGTIAVDWKPRPGQTAPGVGFSEKGGHYIVLDTDDGWRFYFAHLRDEPRLYAGGGATPLVPGQRVEAGAVLGFVGRTGNAVRKRRQNDGTTKLRGCPHLHLAIIAKTRAAREAAARAGLDVLGDHVDPTPLLRGLYELDAWRSAGKA